jgi:uncharacterized protein (DUF305 family)
MKKLATRLLVTSAALAMPALAQDKSSELHQAMSKSMQEMHSMNMTGDIDRDFATMMRHHHQSGIEMARVQARDGKDPELRRQAQKIIDSQKKEIAELDRWLQAKGKSGPAARSGGPTGSSSGDSGSSHHSGHGSGSK